MCLFSLPNIRISKKRMVSWEGSRSGLSAGVPNFQRRHMANPCRQLAKNIKRIENGLISVSLSINKIADHTSKCPKA